MKKIILFLTILALLSCSCEKEETSNPLCDCGGSNNSFSDETRSIDVPEVFTPNGDTKNDEFILYTRNIGCIQLRVYKSSRKKEILFESDDYYQDSFTGKDKDGTVLKAGKYYYEICADEIKLEGYICVFRGGEEVGTEGECSTGLVTPGHASRTCFKSF